MKHMRPAAASICMLLSCCCDRVDAAELANVPRYDVLDIVFTGPTAGPADTPTRDVELHADIRHESGRPTYRIHGYWDGDGAGGATGNRYVVRFCPTQVGRWDIVAVSSNRPELDGQRRGDHVTCADSNSKGFWMVDADSAGGRWFRRSDGSHPYVVGTTYYDFLFRPNGRAATAASVRGDIEDVAAPGLNKVRFGVDAPAARDRDPDMKAFFTSAGKPTDEQTQRINPRFFSERVDVAVRAGLAKDVICELILGFNTQMVKDDCYLKYVMARYGAFPNAWFCVANEWNEATSAAEQISTGDKMRFYLAYPSPISTHGTRGWNRSLNGAWHTHTIRQGKLPSHLPDMAAAADAIADDYAAGGGKPGINDENGYDPGESSELDVLEGVLGSFAGGGYGSTGNKTKSKQGGYFWGFRAQGANWREHPSLDNLGWMRAKIEQHLAFWRLAPAGKPSNSVFSDAPDGFRVLAEDGAQYILLSNAGDDRVTASLGDGDWTVRRLDVAAMSDTLLASGASGVHTFSTPPSRACMTLFLKEGRSAAPDAAAPLGLTAVVQSAGAVALAWTDAGGGKTGFELQRRAAGGKWSTIAKPTAAAHSDSGLAPETLFEYRVRAVNDAAGGAWSETATAKTSASTVPVIISPADGASLSPLARVTVAGGGGGGGGGGGDLAWTVRLAGATLAAGVGPSVAFTVPAAAANGDSVVVELTGAGGAARATYPVSDTTPKATTNNADLADAVVGQPFSDDIEAEGGEAPYRWSADGRLPPGFRLLQGGSLTGTPTTPGVFPFKVQVVDADGDTDSVELTLKVVEPGGK